MYRTFTAISAVSALNVVTLHEAKRHVQRRRAAVAAFQPHRERFEQPREHERQRIEPFDRPLQFDRRLEAFVRERRHERADIRAARDHLPVETLWSEAGGEIGGGKRGEITERSEPPTLQSLKAQG